MPINLNMMSNWWVARLTFSGHAVLAHKTTYKIDAKTLKEKQGALLLSLFPVLFFFLSF